MVAEPIWEAACVHVLDRRRQSTMIFSIRDCGRVALQDAARVAERACGWRAIIFDQEALRAALRVADRELKVRPRVRTGARRPRRALGYLRSVDADVLDRPARPRGEVHCSASRGDPRSSGGRR